MLRFRVSTPIQLQLTQSPTPPGSQSKTAPASSIAYHPQTDPRWSSARSYCTTPRRYRPAPGTWWTTQSGSWTSPAASLYSTGTLPVPWSTCASTDRRGSRTRAHRSCTTARRPSAAGHPRHRRSGSAPGCPLGRLEDKKWEGKMGLSLVLTVSSSGSWYD